MILSRSPWALLTLLVALAALSGCGTMRFEAQPNIPRPVISHIPVTIGLYMPLEFSSYVYKGERYGFRWEVSLGKAQSEALTHLLNAMFERVVPVESIAVARQTDPSILAILEPLIEEFSFVTPRDAGTPFYAVSVKYRVSVYTPDGRLAESWPFTGYGIVPSSSMSAQKPLAQATEMAMRDAGAKLVVEFREQAIIRGLLPQSPRPDTLAAPTEEPLPVEQSETEESLKTVTEAAGSTPAESEASMAGDEGAGESEAAGASASDP